MVLDLLGDRVTAAPVAQHDPAHQHDHERADDRGADGEALPEVKDRPRRGGVALGRAEGWHRAAREGECGEREYSGPTYSSPPARAGRCTLGGQGG